MSNSQPQPFSESRWQQDLADTDGRTRGFSANQTCGPLSILLVDDDPDCRLLVRDAIEESKVSSRVFEAANGLEALQFLAKAGKIAEVPKPGLIYLDIEMPVMDGQETLRAIRAMPDYAQTPIVMMTGVSDAGQMREAAANGANSYTLKPVNAEAFLRTVTASTSYWLSVHQYPEHRLPQSMCLR